jgi:hypothetical protein
VNLGFAPPADVAPATLPATFALAGVAVRPSRAAGGQPAAVVVLIEIQTRPVGA